MTIFDYLQQAEKMGLLEEARAAVKREAARLSEPQGEGSFWTFEDEGMDAAWGADSLAAALYRRNALILKRAKMSIL